MGRRPPSCVELIGRRPLNCETPVSELTGGLIVPNARFYIRNHFPIPALDPSGYRLTVTGHVRRPLSLGLRELRNLPFHTHTVTLECAGNGRALFDPAVPGETWGLGAVSTAEWTGPLLAEVLDRAGVRGGAREVLFRGADGGTVEGAPGPIRFERSLPMDAAREGDVLLLACSMNGEPLPRAHGFPLRAIVPGWYAMASVKWLTEIEVLDRPFTGHYQTDKYVYEWKRGGWLVREPVTLQGVRALIVDPAPGAEVRRGPAAIRGLAWSGAAAIARVEVSVGGGVWREARLVGEALRGAWQWWESTLLLDAAGSTVARARATDATGRTQPGRAEWNRLGYGNNSIHEVHLRVV